MRGRESDADMWDQVLAFPSREGKGVIFHFALDSSVLTKENRK